MYVNTQHVLYDFAGINEFSAADKSKMCKLICDEDFSI